MKEKKELTLFDKAMIGEIPFTLLLAVILLFVTKNENAEIKSLLVGAAISLVLNFFHVKLTMNISSSNYEKLKVFTIISYIARYLIYALVIVLGAYFSNFNPLYIIFGIIEYPLILIILSLTTLRGGQNV
ncbi:hypothetical protein J6Y73_05765 [bacterium]|nr:hypothetical protein [bacterium]